MGRERGGRRWEADVESGEEAAQGIRWPVSGESVAKVMC